MYGTASIAAVLPYDADGESVPAGPCLPDGAWEYLGHGAGADLFLPLCVAFPCHTQSMAALTPLDWQKNLSLLCISPFIKQTLVSTTKSA